MLNKTKQTGSQSFTEKKAPHLSILINKYWKMNGWKVKLNIIDDRLSFKINLK